MGNIRLYLNARAIAEPILATNESKTAQLPDGLTRYLVGSIRDKREEVS